MKKSGNVLLLLGVFSLLLCCFTVRGQRVNLDIVINGRGDINQQSGGDSPGTTQRVWGIETTTILPSFR